MRGCIAIQTGEVIIRGNIRILLDIIILEIIFILLGTM